MKISLGYFVFVFVAIVSVAGCGGSAGANKTAGTGGNGGGTGGSAGAGAVDGGSCSFTACGGNIVGTWRLISICGQNQPTTCPVFAAVDRSQSQTTITFGGNGSYVLAYSGTISETFRYPLECIAGAADAGVAEACAAYQAEVRSAIAAADGGPQLSGLTSFTCSVDANGNCICAEVFTVSSPHTQNGTYTTSGNQVTITITGDGGAVDAGTNPPSDFCVSGNTLTLHTVNNTGESVTTLMK